MKDSKPQGAAHRQGRGRRGHPAGESYQCPAPWQREQELRAQPKKKDKRAKKTERRKARRRERERDK